jgi:putative ATP-dependent endonuclease of OLD family
MKQHPLNSFEFKFRGYKSFVSDYCDIGLAAPINVVIGRNNSGKSSVIGGVEVVATRGQSFDQARHGNAQRYELVVTEQVTEDDIRGHFSDSHAGGVIPGNHYEYGKNNLVGNLISRSIGADFLPTRGRISSVSGEQRDCAPAALDKLNDSLKVDFSKFNTIIVPTDRTVVPEQRSTSVSIRPDGTGVTNAVRAYINHDNLRREVVTNDLLNELNEIYLGDAHFQEVLCQENEHGIWEIFLRSGNGDFIRLSESGSSLQSIFTILSVLRLNFPDNDEQWENVVFCVEEPENNMHPSLLRRLLQHLASKRDELSFCLFITTHSPVCIDWAAKRDDTRIFHVSMDDAGSHMSEAPTNKDRRRILDDLDIRASDILQSNGIIWVEGPSDRIYLNRWITLHSEGDLIEGVHYSVMFYGGRLLNHLQAIDSDSGEQDELISLITLNRNMCVLIDSDKHSKGTSKPRNHLNATKRRIRDECNEIGAMVWITEGREIENYLNDDLISKAFNASVTTKDEFVKITDFPQFKDLFNDKIKFARAVTSLTNAEDLNRLDLQKRLDELTGKICSWNSIQI